MDSSREKYLDKIVEYLVNKTKYDTDHLNLYIIKFPFSDGWEIFGSHREMSDIYDISPERFGIHRWNFDQEMINLFDLLEHESDYVWEEYFKGARFFGNEYAKSDGLINESVNKQKQFLDKVLERILSETEITFGEEKSGLSRSDKIWGKIKYPFLNTWGNSKGSGEYWYDIIEYRYEHRYDYPVRSKGIRDDFLHHCKVVYGLTDKESVKLLKKFRTILKDKIESELFTIYGKDYMSTYREYRYM